MKDISQIDKNLAIKTRVEREGLRFYNGEDAPFSLHGVFREGEKLRRIPEAVAEQVSPGVLELHANTAGGRIRFVTDSPYVAVQARIRPGKMPHFALSGSCGLDMYASCCDGTVRYGGSFIPPFQVEDWFESVQDHTGSWQERTVTIHLPLYSDVYNLYIGLHKDAVVKPAPPYGVETPVVFYGSSITQGGCASRPGNTYQSVLSRRLDFDHVNLGFSGNAKAEDAMVAYIRGLRMRAFVMDYDHNAPSPQYLEQTHGKMFRAIRQAQPQLPIVLMTRPKYYLTEDDQKRHDVVKATYLQAKAQGDANVYFLSGPELMALVKDDGTVDIHHPTDAGFFSMAAALEPVLRRILYG